VKNKAHFPSFSCPYGFIQKKELAGKKDEKSNICSIMRTGFPALLCHLMRTRFTHPWSLLITILVLVSCNKDNRQEFFQLSHRVDFEIVPGLNTFDTHIYTKSLKSLLEENLDAQGRTLSEVVAIEAYQATLSSKFEDVNLDFIDEVSVHIYDLFDHNNKIEFFYREQIPFNDKTSIDLLPGIANIQPWMENEFFGVEIQLNYRQVTPSLIEMKLEFDLRVLGE